MLWQGLNGGKIEQTSKSYVELNFQGDTEEEKNEREAANVLCCQTIGCVPFNYEEKSFRSTNVTEEQKGKVKEIIERVNQAFEDSLVMHKYVIYFLFAVVCISFVLMFVLSFQGEARDVEGGGRSQYRLFME
jgi:hypothetical protein